MRTIKAGATPEDNQANGEDNEHGKGDQEHNETNEKIMNTSNELLELFIVDFIGAILLLVDFESVLHFIEGAYLIIGEAILTTVLIVYTVFKVIIIARNEFKKLFNKKPQ